MANVLRNVVSKQRIRYKEKGFNLDLAYICDNIIAMGYPADNFESMYRNPLGDVYKFLEDNHQDHYKIYNLCLERSYDIAKFHGRVAVYPFEDHNPPAIEMIHKFCDDVDRWLKADPLNVVAVHCKAGKGRTGTMICCYLVYSGKYETADEALACYDEKRTKDRKGVTIPSQRRYVKYFSNLVKSEASYERRTLQFCQIRFSKVNALYSLGAAHCSISVLQEKVQQLQNLPIDFRKTHVLDMNNPSLEVSGDIKVEIAKNTKKVFHLWFNTFFVSETSVVEGEGNNVKYVYTLQKFEIDDAHKDKSFPDDFKVELIFTASENYSKISAGSRPTSDYRSSTQEPSTSQAARSIPQDNSLGSGISSISDQKLSASSSASGSFGVSRSDFSNGYESNMESGQRNNGVVQNINNHHSNNHIMTENELNESINISTPSPAQLATLPPKYMEHQHQEQHQTASKMHTQRNAVKCGGVGEGNIDAPCQPSTNLNNNNSKNSINNSNNCTNLVNNSYNHNHSNSSSKTSSVSSHSSSSAVGDNEEDWESANTTTIENNTQPKEVEETNIITLNNISSADVIKTNNVKETGSNVSTTVVAGTAETTIESISSASNETNDEIQYNQQRSKQIKLDLEAVQLQQQQQEQKQKWSKTQNQSEDNNSTKEELKATTTNKTNKNITKTGTTNTTTNNITSNTTTKQTITTSTTQQLTRSCADDSSELKCC